MVMRSPCTGGTAAHGAVDVVAAVVVTTVVVAGWWKDSCCNYGRSHSCRGRSGRSRRHVFRRGCCRIIIILQAATKSTLLCVGSANDIGSGEYSDGGGI